MLDQTEGHMRLWPTMLYRSLSRLSELGLISPVDPPTEDMEDERRQYYTLTREGRAVLAEEARLLAKWAASALENGA